MKNLIPLIISLMLVVSCGSIKPAAQAQPSRAERVRTETVFQKDTVYLTLPPIQQASQTLDTVSVLDNKYARSEARIIDGTLSHVLQIKPIQQPVTVEKQIIYKDSIVYVQQPAQTVEVERSLTWWQKFKIKIGGWTLALLLIAIVVATLYFVLPTKKSLL